MPPRDQGAPEKLMTNWKSQQARARWRSGWPADWLVLPALGRIGKFGEHSLDAFDENLLLFQLIEGGFPAEIGSEGNRTSE